MEVVTEGDDSNDVFDDVAGGKLSEFKKVKGNGKAAVTRRNAD